MPAPARALEFTYADICGRGPFVQDGTPTVATSAGPKRSASSSSHSPSSAKYSPTPPFWSTATTKESSKHGNAAAAATSTSTAFSSASSHSSYAQIAVSSLSTSRVAATPPTLFHAAYSPPLPFASPQSKSLLTLPISSPSLPVPPQPREPVALEHNSTRPARPTLLIKALQAQTTDSSRALIPLAAPTSRIVTLQPNNLRPHCAARDRLHTWRPFQQDSQAPQHPVQPEDMQRILSLLPFAWADSSKETYGSGLLAYHTFCDFKNIPEVDRAPVVADVLSAFIAHLAGAYAASTVVNYVSAIQAWHLVHRLPWNINERETDLLYKAARSIAPPTSKRPPREPYTLDTLAAIKAQLDLSTPLHAAVFACLTSTFFAAARTGEFTVPNLKAFDPARHITRVGVSTQRDRNGLTMTCFRLPWTKKSPIGEEVNWAKQNDPHDPEEALANHFRVNDPPPDLPLFAYRAHTTRGGMGFTPLTRSKFLKVLDSALSSAGLPPLKGHGIRIGATLEYLLRGIAFDVVKVKGRWAGDSFLIYLRKHAQILAPYMQAEPKVHAAFLQLTIPPIRRRNGP
ncbi:hypothetical protein OG21DRAFT_1447561 [Imleria badia]|nr:hypothetical protein OG21DRAFT_1447561 [Imleria badia]